MLIEILIYDKLMLMYNSARPILDWSMRLE